MYPLVYMEVANIIGLTVLLSIVALFFIVIPVGSKISEERKYKKERAIKNTLESFKTYDEFVNYINTTRNENYSYYSEASSVYEAVNKSSLTPIERINIYILLNYIKMVPEYKGNYSYEHVPAYLYISSGVYLHVNYKLKDMLKEAIKSNDLYSASYIYIIMYLSKMLPYKPNDYLNRNKDIASFDDYDYEDYQLYIVDNNIKQDNKLIKDAYELLKKHLKCDLLHKKEFFDECIKKAFEYASDNVYISYDPEKEEFVEEEVLDEEEIVDEDGYFEDEYEERHINGHVLRFYPEPHKYTVDGNPVKTVTEVVKEWSIDNGYYEYDGVSEYVLQRAADRGIALHKEIELYETSGVMGSTREFRNYLKVKKLIGFEPIDNEIFVFICNDKGKPVCAGRLDFTLDLEGKFGICDIKRTSSYHKEEVELQLNLYRLGYEQLFKKKIEFLRCLRLREGVMEFNKVQLNSMAAKKVIKDYCK